MSTALLRPSAALTIPGVLDPAAKPTEGRAILDGLAVPYAQAEVTLPLTDLAVIEALDPRQTLRGNLTLGEAVAGSSRVLDLSVQSRRISHDGRSMTVGLASDEALLQQYTPLTTDRGAFAYQSSLRSVCNYVLGKVITPRRNLIPNPGIRVNTTGWTTGGGAGAAATLTRGTTASPNPSGTQTYLRATVTAAGTWFQSQTYTDVGTVTPGLVYTFSAWVRTTPSATDTRIAISWRDASNAEISASSSPNLVTTGNYAQMSVTGVAPATASRVLLFVRSAGSVVGEILDLAGALFEQSATAGTFFDGNTVLDGGAYTWEGVANASVSSMSPALLSTPSVDANLTAYWSVTNLMPNPCVRGIIGNWLPGGANGSIARMTTGIGSFPGAPDVTTYTRTTWTGNSGDGQGGAFAQTADREPFTPVQQGRIYRASAWVRSSVAKSVDLRLQVFGRDGTVLNTGITIATVALAANTWTLISGAVETPPEAANLGPFVYASFGTQWASGNTLDATAWMLYEDTAGVDIPFFDGATPNDSNYTYAPVGAAHVSASVRTPTVGKERSPEIFTWRPNTDAWSFLMTLCAVFGYRLFCDELRAWRLIDPNTYTVGGQTIVGTESGTNPTNATAGTDTITRDDDNWCTGVSIRWGWKDKWGIDREQIETAGVAGRVRFLDLDRPYPGPGLAAAILARAVDQGRVQEVTALTRLDATPGMALAVTLPGTRPQRARLDSVRWNIGDGLMEVSGRNAKTVPSIPLNVVATSPSAGRVRVTWSAPTDNGGSPILNYSVFLWTPGVAGGDAFTVSASPFDLTGFTSGASVLVSVLARSAIGSGPYTVGIPLTIT